MTTVVAFDDLPGLRGADLGASGTLVAVEQVGGGGMQTTADVTVEIRDGATPACVAQPVFRFHR